MSASAGERKPMRDEKFDLVVLQEFEQSGQILAEEGRLHAFNAIECCTGEAACGQAEPSHPRYARSNGPSNSSACEIRRSPLSGGMCKGEGQGDNASTMREGTLRTGLRTRLSIGGREDSAVSQTIDFAEGSNCT